MDGSSEDTLVSQWESLERKKAPPGLPVAGSIVLESISSFGGIYGKARLAGNASRRIHILWNAEDESLPRLRETFKKNGAAFLKGVYEGVAESGEVIIRAESIDWIR